MEEHGSTNRMNKETDRLLVVSNGFSGDDLVKYAFEKGYHTEWRFYSMCLPMDPSNAAQDAVYLEGVTHALFVSVDSFSGAFTPLRQILPKMRKMRKDVSVCVDNRSGFCLQPLPRIEEVIDYSINTTDILGVDPPFAFMTCHKPSIMAQAHRHPASFLGSVYNSGMELARLKDSIQSAYTHSLEENGWQNIAYQYESTKARLVNKVKLLLPLIPMSADQGSVSTAFLVPQEAAHLRELLQSLEELGLSVEHRFVTSGLPAISFKTADLIRFEDDGGSIDDVFNCLGSVVRRKQPVFLLNPEFLKQEMEYRQNKIYGEQAEGVKGIV